MFSAPNSEVTVASHRDDDGTTLVQASADVRLRLEPASGAYSAEPNWPRRSKKPTATREVGHGSIRRYPGFSLAH